MSWSWIPRPLAANPSVTQPLREFSAWTHPGETTHLSLKHPGEKKNTLFLYIQLEKHWHIQVGKNLLRRLKCIDCVILFPPGWKRDFSVLCICERGTPCSGFRGDDKPSHNISNISHKNIHIMFHNISHISQNISHNISNISHKNAVFRISKRWSPLPLTFSPREKP